MATISTIGTSARNYSTISAWLAAFATGGWIGECYNDSEFVITSAIAFSGHSTTSPNFITLRTAAGQGFKDNASVQTNALRYNASNGVGVRNTTAYTNVIIVGESFVTIQNLQIQGNGSYAYDNNQSASSGVVLDSCILDIVLTASGQATARLRSGIMRNCLLVNRGNTGNGLDFSYPATGTVAANCTSVRPSDKTAANSAFMAASANAAVKNCAGFGFTNFSSGSLTGSNNCSDQAIGFGTSNQASKTYANQFVNTLNATADFREKSGADLFNNGFTDTTDVPAAVDIVGTARPQSASWDIGCWELIVASATVYSSTLSMMGVG